MANQVFRSCHRVTYAHCTVGNHVYYARYLDLLEAARGEFFRDLGTTFLQWQQTGLAFPVLECQLRFHAAARYDDVLAIDLWLTELTRLRLDFAYRIWNEAATLVGEGSTRHICASVEERPRRMPEDLVQRLRPYLRTEPSALSA